MKLTTALLTGALVIGGIGAGSQFIGPNDRAQAEKKAEEQNLKISYEKAKEIVLNEQKGSISEMELERESGVWVYDIEVKSGGKDYDFYVNADSGEISKKKQDKNQDDDSDDSNIDSKKVKISLEEATKIALKEAKGTVEEAELENEDGKAVYSFEIQGENGKEAEVEISAETGNVLKTEWENED
ncbi:PepSY domain-containing protein [Metabacillus idriensis]|uniref:PepSY domain-containing protein n=1 Tax=Metabacillus idriensis TaxID=324768 RepID=UPI0028144DA4|nr:PepSY domain-containing protein [Metabacillus idriensis]MDR0136896.1 PepSY domain-containing protein [Metabacillus idriensis]